MGDAGGTGKDCGWGEGVPGEKWGQKEGSQGGLTGRRPRKGLSGARVPRAGRGLGGEWSLDNTGDGVRVRSSQ